MPAGKAGPVEKSLLLDLEAQFGAKYGWSGKTVVIAGQIKLRERVKYGSSETSEKKESGCALGI